MALPTDPETLRIPAFMRKRSLRSRLKRPLVLTALDRKKAGVLPLGIEEKRKIVRTKNTAKEPRAKKDFRAENTELNLWQSVQSSKKLARRKVTPAQHAQSTKIKVILPRVSSTRVPAKRKVSLKPAEPETFSPPLIDFFNAETSTPVTTKSSRPSIKLLRGKKSKIIGRISHYYEKIHVAVIALSATLSVGDFITYETADGEDYQQVVESMEIDREPVFKAGKGKEVGIKIRKNPRVGCSVIA